MPPTPPTEAFRAACDAAAVAPEHRQALWRLHHEWSFPGAATARLDALLADYGHWLLFARSRAGDAAAARRFEGHWRGAARTFLGRGFSREQVDEFTSLFFARVYQRAPDFAWRTPFTVFLRTVLLNIARDEVRRLRRSRAREVELDATAAGRRPDPRLDPADPAPSPEQAALDRERQAAVQRALLRLAPVDRQLLVLQVVEQRPGEELAARLGIARDALYKRLQRARERLRRLVDEEVSGG